MTSVSGPRRLLASVRETVRDVRRLARRSDMMVVAAALTCSAAFGLVPLLAIGARVAAWLLGPERVQRAAAGIAQFVPGPLGLDASVVEFTREAVAAPWWTVLLALLPVSLYAEGFVRGLERFSRARERYPRALRGRALTPLLTLIAVLIMLLVAGPVLPLFDGFGTGTGARLLGVFVAFNLMFFPLFGALLVVYRLFASTRLRPAALLWSAFWAASWLAGQLIGYTLAIRFIGGFDHAFGGYAPAAVVAAFSFFIYLENLVFVGGYLLALVLHERRTGAPVTTTEEQPAVQPAAPPAPPTSTSTSSGR
ncbi:YhjD/YihY/BrkB family envelope integrity protein [Nakamurella leprariae]|uniref:YihY/virulence factor BrkB family protein n=1 Tax=Nakamurella leprariae TaxID=2803911 RepID=A0A939C061_9ACTN|nr:YhjD/YihY/BrkB family envelope integrity protein [Nakamurella leprariae]MBM9468895.1 YihY/virulence factor BrkB family protein [Nakamurella leprariae]